MMKHRIRLYAAILISMACSSCGHRSQVSDTSYAVPEDRVVSIQNANAKTDNSECFEPWVKICSQENLCDFPALLTCVAKSEEGTFLDRGSRDQVACIGIAMVKLKYVRDKATALKSDDHSAHTKRLRQAVAQSHKWVQADIAKCEQHTSVYRDADNARFDAKMTRLNSQIEVDDARRQAEQARIEAQKAREAAQKAEQDAQMWQSMCCYGDPH